MVVQNSRQIIHISPLSFTLPDDSEAAIDNLDKRRVRLVRMAAKYRVRIDFLTAEHQNAVQAWVDKAICADVLSEENSAYQGGVAGLFYELGKALREVRDLKEGRDILRQVVRAQSRKLREQSRKLREQELTIEALCAEIDAMRAAALGISVDELIAEDHRLEQESAQEFAPSMFTLKAGRMSMGSR